MQEGARHTQGTSAEVTTRHGVGPGAREWPWLCPHRRLQAQASLLPTVSHGHTMEQAFLNQMQRSPAPSLEEDSRTLYWPLCERTRRGGRGVHRREETDGRAPNSLSPAAQTPSLQEEKASTEPGRQAGRPLAAAWVSCLREGPARSGGEPGLTDLWLLAVMVFTRSGSQMTTSASEPTATRPFLGYRLKILAALVLVTATNWFSSILPVA